VEPEKKTPRERAEALVRLLVPDWRPTVRQGLWAIRIVLAIVVVLGLLTLVGQPFGITLWQWLDLLIVPAVLAIGGYLFTRSENRATRVAAEQRA
jgi:purine-cytosine permease-like protein